MRAVAPSKRAGVPSVIIRFLLPGGKSPVAAAVFLILFVGDRVIATAILDRVLHHAITINIRGNSYRLKDKLKAGLVRAEEPEAIN